MNINRTKLSSADAKAIDLILDPSDQDLTKSATHVSQPHLIAATKLLHLLDNLHADEPPAGLAAKTMRFIARANEQRVAPHTTTPTTPSAHMH